MESHKLCAIFMTFGSFEGFFENDLKGQKSKDLLAQDYKKMPLTNLCQISLLLESCKAIY